MTAPFPDLFSPIRIGGVEIRNLILSTGHDTSMSHGGLVGDQLVAYHRARAAGGVGLIVIQVSGIHETARYTSHLLMATSDDCIPGYRALAEAVHEHGACIFGQLFHPGREIMEGQDPPDGGLGDPGFGGNPVIDAPVLAQGDHPGLDIVRRFVGAGVRPGRTVLQTSRTFAPITPPPLVDGAGADAHRRGDVLGMFSTLKPRDQNLSTFGR